MQTMKQPSSPFGDRGRRGASLSSPLQYSSILQAFLICMLVLEFFYFHMRVSVMETKLTKLGEKLSIGFGSDITKLDGGPLMHTGEKGAGLQDLSSVRALAHETRQRLQVVKNLQDALDVITTDAARNMSRVELQLQDMSQRINATHALAIKLKVNSERVVGHSHRTAKVAEAAFWLAYNNSRAIESHSDTMGTHLRAHEATALLQPHTQGITTLPDLEAEVTNTLSHLRSNMTEALDALTRQQTAGQDRAPSSSHQPAGAAHTRRTGRRAVVNTAASTETGDGASHMLTVAAAGDTSRHAEVSSAPSEGAALSGTAAQKAPHASVSTDHSDAAAAVAAALPAASVGAGMRGVVEGKGRAAAAGDGGSSTAAAGTAATHHASVDAVARRDSGAGLSGTAADGGTHATVLPSASAHATTSQAGNIPANGVTTNVGSAAAHPIAQSQVTAAAAADHVKGHQQQLLGAAHTTISSASSPAGGGQGPGATATPADGPRDEFDDVLGALTEDGGGDGKSNKTSSSSSASAVLSAGGLVRNPQVTLKSLHELNSLLEGDVTDDVSSRAVERGANAATAQQDAGAQRKLWGSTWAMRKWLRVQE